MKKLLLIFILVVVSSSATAEWVEIGQNESKEPLSTYADPDTIQKEENIIKMWVLHEFSIPRPELDFISAKHKEEYDCKEKKRRVLFIAFYSGHMGGGETVDTHSEPQANWQQPPVGSLAEAVLEFACGFHPKMPETFPEETFS